MLRRQKLPDTAHGRHTLQFFRTVARRVAKCLSFENAAEESFPKQAAHCRQDRVIGLPDRAILQYFANGGSASRPHGVVNLSLQRPKMRGWGTFEDGMKRIHCVPD